jgi:hypothetical protein
MRGIANPGKLLFCAVGLTRRDETERGTKLASKSTDRIHAGVGFLGSSAAFMERAEHNYSLGKERFPGVGGIDRR